MVDFKFILGILGNITAILLFASPIPTYRRIFHTKSIGDYSGIPYVCTLLNCLLWVIYGLPVVEFQLLVVTINAAGCIIELTYITMYLIYAPQKTRMKVMRLLAGVLVAFVVVVVLVLELVHSHKTRKLVIGSLCAVFAVGMYASPLTVMGMVIRTRSVEYMPLLLSVFNFINGLVWFGYAFFGGIDIFIMIPNGLGALSGLAQLSLYAFYRNATPIKGDMGVELGEDVDEKGNPMKPVPHSVYVQMEKNGDDPALNKQSGRLPKHHSNGST